MKNVMPYVNTNYAPGNQKHNVDRKPKAVTLTSFKSHVSCVKISFHICSHWRTLKVLKAIWSVCFNENASESVKWLTV